MKQEYKKSQDGKSAIITETPDVPVVPKPRTRTIPLDQAQKQLKDRADLLTKQLAEVNSQLAALK